PSPDMCNWYCLKKNACSCFELEKKFRYKPWNWMPENRIAEKQGDNKYDGENKNYKWYELYYEAKRYSKHTSHNSYDCRFRKKELPFEKKVKCSYRWCELCYKAKHYSKHTSHNSYDCRFRKEEPLFEKEKFKCNNCSKY
ncbi:4460_t:CDS:1, partial [Gigaspora margarita]